jgi:ankyrin repeat protein
MASDLNPKGLASLASREKSANDGRKHNHSEMSKRSGAEMAKRTDKFMAIFNELYNQSNAPEIRPPLQEQVKTLINHEVEVNARSEKGDPLLVFAVKTALRCIGRTTDEDEQMMIRRYIKIICQLIDHSANPNMQDSTGRTPLLLAIGYESIIHKHKGEQEDFIKLLIEKGVHVEQERMDFKGERTPLIAASRRLRHSVVELLLARNFNVNANVDGETALYTAARPGYDIYPMRVPKIFSMLLGHGGDPKRELRRILSRTTCSCPGAVEPLLVHIFGEPEWHSHLNALPNIPQEITSSSTLEMEYRNFTANLYQLILMEIGSIDSPRQSRKLCSSCQTFESHARFREWFFHSTNPEALSRSIFHGCAMCSIIKDCLPESCKEIQLYYFSVRPQENWVSRDYYDRILVRCQKQGSLKDEGYVLVNCVLLLLMGCKGCNAVSFLEKFERVRAKE